MRDKYFVIIGRAATFLLCVYVVTWLGIALVGTFAGAKAERSPSYYDKTFLVCRVVVHIPLLPPIVIVYDKPPEFCEKEAQE